MLDPREELPGLVELARQARVDVLKMLNRAGSGHTGGSLSAVDILVALFFGHMRLKADDPCWRMRDRFVLSKGHAAPALYAVLAKLGYLRPDDLMTLRQVNSCLQGHPDAKMCTGVECSTGSLGQGLGMALGLALGMRLDKLSSRVYALLGDGEMQEGMVWEAAMAAAHYRAANLTAICDNNGLQIDGRVAEVMNVEPLGAKWRAFGWNALEVDGHDMEAIVSALQTAAAHEAGPSIIIARTVKGKGVSLFENRASSHGVAPSDHELKVALRELGEVPLG
ncbi:transketolase [Desulfocarbo indianensis]|nr:transketolase [Desulfocarbo indianensis]